MQVNNKINRDASERLQTSSSSRDSRCLHLRSRLSRSLRMPGLLRSWSGVFVGAGLCRSSAIRFISIGGKTATPPIGRRGRRSPYESSPDSCDGVLAVTDSGVVAVVDDTAPNDLTLSSRLDRSES